MRTVPATGEHAIELGNNMRAADAAEVMASDGFRPIDAVLRSMDVSTFSKALLIGGAVACIWGVMPAPDPRTHIGIPWALTSPLVERYPKVFLKACRLALVEMLARYRILINSIDARHTQALRWAEWLGFDVHEPQPYGPEGRPFCVITLIRRYH